MRKLALSVLWVFSAFTTLAQGKLQVTDFVFFNNLNAAENPYLPNFFSENSDGLEQTKTQLSSLLKEKYDLNESSFYEKAISYIDNSEKAGAGNSYKENHKALSKKGGFDHYFSATSAVSEGSQADRFLFKTEIKLSNAKGKKVFDSSVEIPFSASFKNDAISTKDLLSSEDFYKIYNTALAKAFQDSKDKEELQVYYRPKDSQFDEFIENASYYTLNGFLSSNPVLVDGDSEIAIRIMSNDSEIDITKANEGMLLHGKRLEKPIVSSFRNPMSSNYWVTLVQGKVNSGFEDLNLAPSADIFLSFNTQPGVSEDPPLFFRLINGRLTGKLDSKTYLISFEPGSSLLRIFADQKLLLLSQPLETGKGEDLKIFYSGASEDFADVINLHEVYFHSINALKEKLGQN